MEGASDTLVLARYLQEVIAFIYLRNIEMCEQPADKKYLGQGGVVVTVFKNFSNSLKPIQEHSQRFHFSLTSIAFLMSAPSGSAVSAYAYVSFPLLRFHSTWVSMHCSQCNDQNWLSCIWFAPHEEQTSPHQTAKSNGLCQALCLFLHVSTVLIKQANWIFLNGIFRNDNYLLRVTQSKNTKED